MLPDLSLDNWISLISALIAFAGLGFVALQLRDSNHQREIESIIEIYDINRALLSLGFAHPELFAILRDAKTADPVWERRYLQLWLNQMSLIHLCLRHSVFNQELRESLECDLDGFLTMKNMQRHWQKFGRFYPASFQRRMNGCLEKMTDASE